MSYSRAQHLSSLDNPARRLAGIPRILRALAVVLVVVGLTMPDAYAAAPAAAGPITAYSQSSGKVAPDPTLAQVTLPPAGDATVPAAAVGQSVTIAQPRDESTGIFIGGPVSAAASNGTATLRAGALINDNATATGNLTLDLVATATVPSGSFTGDVLAHVSIGSIPAKSEISNYDSGALTFGTPSAGCYYLSLVLVDGTTVEDIRTLPAGGTPENTGYSEFGFGQTCPAATTCTRNANTVCLDSGRFQVTVAYDNTATGAGTGQVLLFGSTRAESDESGFFYFTDPSNFEMGVKVLNACGVNNFWWVFIGGLTNQGWSLNVLDTSTGQPKFYGNTDGVLTVTTADTGAIACP